MNQEPMFWFSENKRDIVSHRHRESYGNVKNVASEYSIPLYAAPVDFEALRKEIADLKAHNEKLTMRLVECGNATMGNMWGSAKNCRIDKTNQNWSAQYDMVCKVVDRGIALDKENRVLKNALNFCERAAVHHAKSFSSSEIVGMIANHPTIRDITEKYGETPAADDPIEILQKQKNQLKELLNSQNDLIEDLQWLIDILNISPDLTSLRKENENLRKQLNSLIYPVAKLAEEWSEEDGNVIWHKFPIDEPPYVGTPLDSNWIDDYYTHWQPLPPIPSIF